MKIRIFGNHFISEENNRINKAILRSLGRYPETSIMDDQTTDAEADAKVTLLHVSPFTNEMNHRALEQAGRTKMVKQQMPNLTPK